MRRMFSSFLTLLVLMALVPGMGLADTAWMTMTSQNSDWNDYLEVDNTGPLPATFTITLYDASGSQVYSYSHNVGAYEYKTILIKSLVSTASSGKITYTNPALFFRMAYESVSAGGVAEFLLGDETTYTALLLFSNFSASTIWKGAAVMNTGASTATLTVYGFAGGSYLGKDTHTLAPNAMKALTPELWLPSLDANTAITAERLIITSTQPVTAITISGDGTTSKLLFAPGVNLTGFTPPTDPVSSPNLVGTWTGMWTSEDMSSGNITLVIESQSPAGVLDGSITLTNTECGTVTESIYGAVSGTSVTIAGVTNCGGVQAALEFANGILQPSGTSITNGEYELSTLLDPDYDAGTWYLNKQ